MRHLHEISVTHGDLKVRRAPPGLAASAALPHAPPSPRFAGCLPAAGWLACCRASSPLLRWLAPRCLRAAGGSLVPPLQDLSSSHHPRALPND
jgi:hypothetical protein